MISVIVCTHNRCESLRETLQALATQRLGRGLRLEVIVVDNNSADATKTVVEDAAGNSRWPIRYVFERRQGKSMALNRGIREADGKFLMLTDDDALPEPTWAQALYGAFVRHRADCVGGRVVPVWLRRPPRWLRSPKRWGYLAMLDHGPTPLVAGRDSTGDFLLGVNLGFRKTALKRVGTFRTDLGPVGMRLTRCEDSELVQRFILRGKRVVYTPEAVVRHKVEPQRMELPYIRRHKFHVGRSAARFVNQDTRVPAWLVRQCAANGVAALVATARRQEWPRVQHEARFWYQLGRIVGGLRRR